MNPAELINSPAFAGGEAETEQTSSSARPTWGDVAKTILLPKEVPFHLRIKKATYTLPKDKVDKDGNQKFPYINFQFVVMDEGEFLGENVFDNFTMKPGKMFMLRKLAEKAGLDLEAMAGEEFNEKVYEGLEIKATFSIEEGKDGFPPKNKINTIFAIDEI